MKDSQIAWIGAGISWVVLIAGGVATPFAIKSYNQSIMDGTLNARGLTADQPETMGDIAKLMIPAGFKPDPYAEDEAFDPEFHEDPDAMRRSWQISAPRTIKFPPKLESSAPRLAELQVVIADPASAAMDIWAADLENATALTAAGPVEIYKIPAPPAPPPPPPQDPFNPTFEPPPPPPMSTFVGINRAAGHMVELRLLEPAIYSDAEARNVLVSIIGSIQTDKTKFEALLEGPRTRAAEAAAAREEVLTAATERLTKLLVLKPNADGILTSAAGDVLVNDILWLKVATRPAAGVTGGGFALVDPLPENLAAFSSDGGEPTLDLIASGKEADEWWSMRLLTTAAIANEGAPERTAFFPDPAVAAQAKPGEITLWRMIYLDEAPDVASVGIMETMVTQTKAWRAGKSAKPWAQE